jgi:hypothetical protein
LALVTRPPRLIPDARSDFLYLAEGSTERK